MILRIKSVAIGSTTPIPVPPNQSINNGDFQITSNAADRNRATGDGVDEGTNWTFDLKTNAEWKYFSREGAIESAKLSITLSPKPGNFETDILRINYGSLGNVDPSTFRSIPVGETRTVEIDLLASGYTSQELLRVLNDNNGVVPMLYGDDAIVSYAELEITQQLRSYQGNRLIVEAVSEDTIAAPGNRSPNYLLVSVTDINGEPIKDLTVSNFKVDPMIVGAGGALVNVTSVRHSNRIDGFYFLDLLPIRQETWKKGVYVLAVAVSKENKKGQTLTSVLMD